MDGVNKPIPLKTVSGDNFCCLSIVRKGADRVCGIWEATVLLVKGEFDCPGTVRVKLLSKTVSHAVVPKAH